MRFGPKGCGLWPQRLRYLQQGGQITLSFIFKVFEYNGKISGLIQ